MIQRKQTLFLLAAFLVTVVCMISLVSAALPFVVLLLSALMTVVTIFTYKKRKLQIQLCTVLIMLYVLWYVLLAAQPQQADGEWLFEWPMVLPAVSAILTFLARKGVVADEKLVRSLDRIR